MIIVGFLNYCPIEQIVILPIPTTPLNGNLIVNVVVQLIVELFYFHSLLSFFHIP